jgi:hypothetical protein
MNYLITETHGLISPGVNQLEIYLAVDLSIIRIYKSRILKYAVQIEYSQTSCSQR